ncbi:hypothetical protein [Mesorhizobium sp. WSM2239]|uniref:ABC transmembrane type-1 domain-containing protein n=2 Tax=unclassified Mesorhizobium TaxID=325217 RepID=A0AAU8DGG6_9HYPH
MLAALAYPVIGIVLGNQWSEAAPLVQAIAVASLFTFSLVAMGSIWDMFMRSLIVILVSVPVITASLFLGGLQDAAPSTLLIVPFQALVTLALRRRRLGRKWSELTAAVRRSGRVAASSPSGLLAVAPAARFTFERSLGQAADAGLGAASGQLAGLLATCPPLGDEVARITSALNPSIAPRVRMATGVPEH